MDEAKILIFKNKIIRGTVALTARTFLLQGISFLATFILTILLSPSVFGVFFIVSAFISFLSYFSDIGLAAALVQKKDEPKRLELVSVFTLQQAIVILLVSIAFLFIPQVSDFYALSTEGIFLLKALLVSFFLASLKTIPSIILERRLEFSSLVIPQILENITFYTVAIIAALLNYQVASFAWAALARGVVGLVSIYIISPWIPGIGFSLASVKKLISFGVPFQVNSLLALVKDDLLTLYLGKFLPFQNLGYLGWAKKWAEVPLRLIMDSIIRVTFPAFSRIQNEREYMSKAINKTIFFLALFVFPVSALLIIYIKPLIFLIPKYIKWQPALTAFYLFAVSSVFSAFASPMVNALNALGKIQKSLFLMVFWTVLTWILVPVLTALIGFNGWPLASVFISLFIFLPVLILKRYVTFSFIENISKPLILTVLMSIFSIITLQFTSSIASLFILAAFSSLIYAILVWICLRNEIKPLVSQLINRK